MAVTSSVLILKTKEDKNFFEIEEISSDSIPDKLNGENGFHIFHISVLTELILKEYRHLSGSCDLSDEDITAMSAASSLHDIGKIKMPDGILDLSKRLSSVEYDIAKKHTASGEEIINEINSDIDKTVIKYAKEIARWHHERVDGTGYPDSLKGNDIPLCAQVVGLADAFDGLTSARNDKDAFSQDVAIEMIANGMCGAFDSLLTDCLLNVINDNYLVEIREKLNKKRQVITDPDSLKPKKILLMGNTGYITERFIKDTFEDSPVVIAGDTHLKSFGKVRVYKGKNLPLEEIFMTYDFDVIIFFAGELTYDFADESDAEDLRKALSLTHKTQDNAKVIYFSSLDGAYSEKNDLGILTQSKENLCEFYTREFDVDVKIVRIPYLYSGTYKEDFLYKLFSQAEEGYVRLDEKEASRAFFISMYDISSLTARFIENWQEGIGTLNINDEFYLTFSDIKNELIRLNPSVKIEFTGEARGYQFESKNTAVRNEYGWFSKISIVEDLEEQYDGFLVLNKKKTKTLSDKIKKWISQHEVFIKLIELFGMFVITECLNLLTGSSVIFSVVDFRMAFIVIIATVHGLYYGLAASGLSSLAWLIAKILSGTNWLTIFYEPTNWFAFIYYFLIGAICGYVRLAKDDKIAAFKKQNALLEEKLEFTRELYKDTFEEKREFKKQIIGSKDSFGKIFDVTRNLDTVEPHRLYLKIMETFEDILENKSLCVYSVNESGTLGRLEVASRDIIANAARSISLDSYQPIMSAINKDEIWKNTAFLPNLPMYAAGIWRKERLELIIFIWHVLPEQNSLYYVNLFKILSDLVEISLLRAYDYNQHLYETQYIKGTRILSKEEFNKTLNNFTEMAEKKVFSYILVEIGCNGYTLYEADKLLSGKIRANDILGDMGDGKLGLLLPQTTKNELKHILSGFDGVDLAVRVKE